MTGDRKPSAPRAPFGPVPSARSPVPIDWIAVPLHHFAFTFRCLPLTEARNELAPPVRPTV
jgi:hypothetical protein